MEHVYYESGDGHACDTSGECMLCSVGCCKVCGGLAGSLTTDCCGTWMTRDQRDQRDQVYKGRLDYREKEGWINELSPPHQTDNLEMHIIDNIRNTDWSLK